MSDRSIVERMEAREFDDPKVRAYLNSLPIETVEYRLGMPRIVTRYAEPIGYWRVGDGKPLLADDDPAAMQAIGRCSASRTRGARDVLRDSIHAGPCGWCDYPMEMLLAACDWATWHSRFVTAELHIWAKGEHAPDRWVTYEREARSNVYENPAYQTFFALPSRERRERVERMMAPRTDGPSRVPEDDA